MKLVFVFFVQMFKIIFWRIFMRIDVLLSTLYRVLCTFLVVFLSGKCILIRSVLFCRMRLRKPSVGISEMCSGLIAKLTSGLIIARIFCKTNFRFNLFSPYFSLFFSMFWCIICSKITGILRTSKWPSEVVLQE